MRVAKYIGFFLILECFYSRVIDAYISIPKDRYRGSRAKSARNSTDDHGDAMSVGADRKYQKQHDGEAPRYDGI